MKIFYNFFQNLCHGTIILYAIPKKIQVWDKSFAKIL